MIVRSAKEGGHSWQLVLADLSLILFLVTLTALVNAEGAEQGAAPSSPYIAPAQALFRPTDNGPSLSEWLEEQAVDPRMTLTIVAQHSGIDREAMWQAAQDMVASIKARDIRKRVIITEGETSDVFASLAYDDPD